MREVTEGFSGFQNVWFRGLPRWEQGYYARVTCSNLHKFEKGKNSAPFEGGGVFVNLERKYQQQTIIGLFALMEIITLVRDLV